MFLEINSAEFGHDNQVVIIDTVPLSTHLLPQTLYKINFLNTPSSSFPDALILGRRGNGNSKGDR
jgi:hypothetical protein